MGLSRQFGKAKGLLFGSKPTSSMQEVQVDPDIKKTQDLAREQQRLGLGGLRSAYGDPSLIARAQAAREAAQVRGGTEDARRRLQGLIAQRGLSRSSVGLGQQVALGNQQIDKLGAIQASLPERIQRLKLARAQGLIGGASTVLGAPGLQKQVFQQNIAGSKGLLGSLGAIAGGAMGGPGGAAMGGAAGEGLSGMFRK